MEKYRKNELINLSAPLEKAFSYINDTAFFIKDLDGFFVAANDAFLRLMGVARRIDIVGKTDLDFVPYKLARAYMHDDRKVMDTGEPLENRIEPPPHENRTDARIVTSKFPLRSQDGSVLGLVGIAKDLTDGTKRPAGATDFSKTITRLEDPNFKRYDAAELARIQGMSKSKFEREFKKLFQITPAVYHLQTRLRWARNDLLHTTKPVNEIALEHGFCDQSHFTKRFQTTYGMPPLRYRKKASIPLPQERKQPSP